MTQFGAVTSNTLLSAQPVQGINNFRKGVTAPADGSLGTTPTVPTLLFTATNQLLTIGTLMPTNWDRDIDVDLVLSWALAAVQVNNDTLDVTINYTVPRYGVGGTGPGKASTSVTGQITAVTGELAIGDPYQMVIPLNRVDATNPYDTGASGTPYAFAFEINLTNVTGIASAHFVGSCISYQRQE